jgi:hypothetical protein
MRALHGALVASIVVASAAVAVAGPQDLDGEWSVTGAHSQLGAYTGWLRVAVAPDGSARLDASLRTASGTPIAWNATGRALADRVDGKLSSTAGVAGLLGGAAQAPGGTATYTLAPDGSLKGTWTQKGATGTETLTKVRAPTGLPVNFDWDDDRIEELGKKSPEKFDAATIDQRARAIEILEKGGTSDGEEVAILAILRRSSPLQRYQIARHLDEKGDASSLTHLVYDDLDGDAHRNEALRLLAEGSFAAKRDGLLELGLISDIDDTAVPTKFKPDGDVLFKGAPELYRLIENGLDGKGSFGDIHYLSARPVFLIPNAKSRLAKAGMPPGTFDRGNVLKFLTSGLDGTENEKVKDGERWLALHAAQRFVCFGDTRERDPEVYRTLAARHPDQIALVLIHEAGGPKRDHAQFPGQQFFDTYPNAEKLVRAAGLVMPGAKQP